MTQTPDPDQPGNDDTTPLPPGPPPAPHGDPVAGDQQWGQASPPPPLPPPPPPGAEPGWQPQHQEQYQQQYPPAPPPYQQDPYQQGYAQQGYPQGQPGAPYGIHPGTGIPYSEKSKLVAGLLQIFVAGVGRMYMGQVGLGIAQLCVAIFTCGVGALWSLIDGILILTKDDPRDAQGRILKS